MDSNCYCEETTEAETDNRDEKSSNRIYLHFASYALDRSDKETIKKAKAFFLILEETGLKPWTPLWDYEYDDDYYNNYDASEYYGESSRSLQGQRFSMSRDFWYRKLNTLKARKLDEAAMESKDIPPRNRPKALGVPFKVPKSHRIFADEVPENIREAEEEIQEFEKNIIKKQPSGQFVNIYNNRDFFHNAS